MKKLTTASVKVSRVMTKSLITVSPDSLVEEAVRKMVDLDWKYNRQNPKSKIPIHWIPRQLLLVAFNPNESN